MIADPAPDSSIRRPAPLDADAFAAFGVVVEARTEGGIPVNQGRALRFDAAPALGHDSQADRHAIALYQVEGAVAAIEVDLLERHPLSDQLFVPMAGARYLVVVAAEADDGGPDPLRLQVFAAAADQAVIYRRGVWHYPIASLGRDGRFTMVMWEAGDARDTEIRRLARPIRIEL